MAHIPAFFPVFLVIVLAFCAFLYVGGYLDSFSIERPFLNHDRTEFYTAATQEPMINHTDYEDAFTRDYAWEYDSYQYGLTFTLYPEVYEEFRNRARIREYDLFASDSYSQPFIAAITEELKAYAARHNLTETQIPYFVISFVQDLPYTSDNVTTGFDEYPRFPYETLYDNGGDCEDTSILASALLHELGYGVALLEFSDHMAVGVKCDPRETQVYYTFNNVTYCYLETTGRDWNIGEVPPNVAFDSATVRPITPRVSLQIERLWYTSRYNTRDAYIDVNLSLTNVGSKTATQTRVYVALETEDEGTVWDQHESEALQITPEEFINYSVTSLRAPADEAFRVYVFARDGSAVSNEIRGEFVTLV